MTQPTATGKVIIFSAPSGAGKSTIIGRLLRDFPQLEFSISATSRAPRGKEVHGCEYYFLDHDDFLKRAGNGEFVDGKESMQAPVTERCAASWNGFGAKATLSFSTSM